MKIRLSSWLVAVLVIPFVLGCWGCGKPSQSTGNDDPQDTASSSSASGKTLTPKPRKKAGPVEHIDSTERIAAVKLVEVNDPVQREIDIFIAEIRGAFDEKKFDLLESKAKDLRASRELFGDGSWKLTQFYFGVDERFHTGDDGFLTDLETHEAWEKAHPDSVAQKVALANLLVTYAWDARGSGYTDTVTQRAWTLFHERLEQAEKVLESARSHPEKDPYLPVVAIKVGMGLSVKRSQFEALVEEGRSIEPAYWVLDTRRAYSLLPRWFGEEGEWETFALEAADREDGLGDEVYARIAMSLTHYYADIFRDSGASWERTRKGLAILKEKYPDSVTIANYTARLATMGRDRELAKATFDELGNAYVKSVWKKPERFVHFRTWAETGKW